MNKFWRYHSPRNNRVGFKMKNAALTLRTIYRLGLYLIGLAGTCIGVSLCLKSTMGVDAWNAAIAGSAGITPISIGIWTIIIHLVFWIISTLISRKIKLESIIPVLYICVYYVQKSVGKNAIKYTRLKFLGGDKMYLLELAQSKDVAKCYAIIKAAKEFQREQGFIQWTDDYPNESTIRDDVDTKKGYIFTVDSDIAGYMCIDFSGEPA